MALSGQLPDVCLRSVLARCRHRALKITCLLIFVSSLVILHHFRGLIRNLEAPVLINDVPSHFGLLLDTPGCKIPQFHPYDPSVKDLITARKQRYVCGGDPLFMVTTPNGTILLDDHALKTAYGLTAKNVSCSYQGIFREKETAGHPREISISYGDVRELQFGHPIEEEFLKVHCRLGPKKKFTQFIPLVPIKPDVEKRASEAPSKSPDSLNVILIGIDSVSRLNFQRHFKKTRKFLLEKMSAFDMKGYTKVGDNTFPNLVPLLTGHFVEHYWNESVKDEMFFDDLDFIWKTYASRGYRTFYAEDSPFFGTFQYLKRGFEHPPTDYYLRPLVLAIYKAKLWKNEYCLNDQLETEIFYSYLKDFVKRMEDRPHFAFTMVSSLTHNKLNDAGYCDEPTYDLLKGLWDIGAMNRSMVIVFSDHGLRFGPIRERYIGKFEERLPFMHLALPPWFLEKYKDIARNLKTNQNRLITLFDVHATLNHLLDVAKPVPDDVKPRATPNGLSLFENISKYRSCETAKVLPHWCSCQVLYQVPKSGPSVISAASAIVDEINEQLLEESSCALLQVDLIADARIRLANDKVLRFVRHENDVLNRRVVYGDEVEALADYLITLRTTPGGAMFEGTVRHDQKKGRFKVKGISRINEYGNQSNCVDRPALKKVCFCENEPPQTRSPLILYSRNDSSSVQ